MVTQAGSSVQDAEEEDMKTSIESAVEKEGSVNSTRTQQEHETNGHQRVETELGMSLWGSDTYKNTNIQI